LLVGCILRLIEPKEGEILAKGKDMRKRNEAMLDKWEELTSELQNEQTQHLDLLPVHLMGNGQTAMIMKLTGLGTEESIRLLNQRGGRIREAIE
jgi:ABC-type oligopeptide transport system ATPase subunit